MLVLREGFWKNIRKKYGLWPKRGVSGDGAKTKPLSWPTLNFGWFWARWNLRFVKLISWRGWGTTFDLHKAEISKTAESFYGREHLEKEIFICSAICCCLFEMPTNVWSLTMVKDQTFCNIFFVNLPLGKLHRTVFYLYLDIAQIAVRPPSTQTGTLGYFFRALFEGLYGSNSKNPGKGLDPPPNWSRIACGGASLTKLGILIGMGLLCQISNVNCSGSLSSTRLSWARPRGPGWRKRLFRL